MRYHKDLQDIKDIGENTLADKLKKNAKNNMRGSLIGGGVGLVIGLLLKKNVVVFGIGGLILGRLILVLKNK